MNSYLRIRKFLTLLILISLSQIIYAGKGSINFIESTVELQKDGQALVTYIVQWKVNDLSLPAGVIHEYNLQNDIEIIVIRQYTTKTSGYHTKPNTIDAIYNAAIENAINIIGKEN